MPGTDAPYVDRAREVRAGEKLDSSRLTAYLADVLPDLTGPLTILQFFGYKAY